MRLLLEIGYQKVLFGKNAPISEILASLDNVKAVDQVGYGEFKQFEIMGDVSIQAQLINDDSISLPDTVRNKEYETFHAIAKERDELSAKVYELEKKLKEIQSTIENKKE